MSIKNEFYETRRQEIKKIASAKIFEISRNLLTPINKFSFPFFIRQLCANGDLSKSLKSRGVELGG